MAVALGLDFDPGVADSTGIIFTVGVGEVTIFSTPAILFLFLCKSDLTVLVARGRIKTIEAIMIIRKIIITIALV